ncbi:hypothetical protein [Rhodococcus sp. H29-C3]|nr:hypothetical protein [Rhodococcus sp. H29-C3]MDJ0362989.1 hypothetical protein [Rhodococcus sp. H29-C3]
MEFVIELAGGLWISLTNSQTPDLLRLISRRRSDSEPPAVITA